jgi:hypothetical protein
MPWVHSPEQVAQLAASIREWGWTAAILVNEQDHIVAGHGRPLTAQQLGLTEVPVMVARGWTEAQIQAYRLADNRLALNATWDENPSLEMGELKGLGADLSLTGRELELDALFVSTDGNTDADEAPDLPAVPVSRPVTLDSRRASHPLRRCDGPSRHQECAGRGTGGHVLCGSRPTA